MSNTTKVLIAVGVMFGFILVGVIWFGGIYISVNNTCVQKEAILKASKKQSENVYDNFWKSVKEVAQVPANYSKDLKETYAAIMDSRYKNSQNVMMNWIKEANPDFDSSMYKQVQQVIESGRNDFKDSQKQLIDEVRDYETYKGQIPTSFFVSLAGFPKINLEDFRPVTSDRTENAFETHKDSQVDVFGK